MDMPRISVKVLVLLIIMLICPDVGRNQTHNVRDGNWWIEKEELYKLEYTTGFFDGIELGHKFSYWGVIENQKKEQIRDDATMQKIGGSFQSYTDKYLTDVTA